jgi:hypothetical protein
MKHNAEKAAALVTQAIRVCQDFALTPARAHLFAALAELNKVANKRDKREKLRLDLEKQLQAKREKEAERLKKLREKVRINTEFPNETEGS